MSLKELMSKAQEISYVPKSYDEVFTPERQESFMCSLAVGVDVNTAARFAGLPPGAVLDRLHRGQATLEELNRDPGFLPSDDDQFYLSFYIRTMRTMADVEMDLVKQVKGSADTGDWRAAAFLLERRFSATWSKKSTNEVQVAGEVTHKHEDRPQLDATEMLDALAGRLAEIDRRRSEIVDAEIVDDDED